MVRKFITLKYINLIKQLMLIWFTPLCKYGSASTAVLEEFILASSSRLCFSILAWIWECLCYIGKHNLNKQLKNCISPFIIYEQLNDILCHAHVITCWDISLWLLSAPFLHQMIEVFWLDEHTLHVNKCSHHDLSFILKPLQGSSCCWHNLVE